MARPEVGRGYPQRLARRSARGALLTLAAQVEQRVIDADRHPDDQHHFRGARPDRQPPADDGQQGQRGHHRR